MRYAVQAVEGQGVESMLVQLGAIGQPHACLQGFISRLLKAETPAQRHLYVTEWCMLEAASAAPGGATVTGATRDTHAAVLVLSCGEPFDAASVPERARRMHAAAQEVVRRLGPLVRAEQTRLLPETRAPPPERPEAPWRFSPSGRWHNEGLALRPQYRA